MKEVQQSVMPVEGQADAPHEERRAYVSPTLEPLGTWQAVALGTSTNVA